MRFAGFFAFFGGWGAPAGEWAATSEAKTAAVTIHAVSGTPNGDGVWKRRVKLPGGGQRVDEVAVDSGTLCIVEHHTGWPEEEPAYDDGTETTGTRPFFGARYHTLRAAMAAFSGVLRRF